MGPLPEGSYFVDRRRRMWVRVRHHHVVLMRGRRTVWRSARTYRLASANGLSGIQVSGSGIAYQLDRTDGLWVAPGRGPERSVSVDEWPVMWTASGDLLTVRRSPSNRFAYLLRDRNGRLVETLASRLRPRFLNFAIEITEAGAFLLWNSHGELVWTDGSTTRILARAGSLGFRGLPSIYPLDGGLIELLSRRWHEVVLRFDGSVFARASAPADGSVAGFGDQAAAPDGSAVAYVLTEESSGATSVYMLRAGDRRGTRIYRVSKGKGFPPSWHGHWLLFVDESGKVVAIDASARSRPINLTRAIQRLQRANGGTGRKPPHWSFATSQRLLSR